ncbi:hypothetical protein [Acinetobacter guerrae]|uniref:hypothetical protein n=1 Tax=Acinetobacter guerrae TaxID=1843371 RepID=UPI00128C452E|nr:hypothetical protein [Acinetobacter guerrae]MPW45099.1 hypothetical protein [Acinetobacter guerrae]
MSNINAIKLIIENIQMLEQANGMINDEITIKLFETVDHVIQDKVESFQDGEWDGYFNFSADYLAFAPSNWKVVNSNKFNQNFYARYSLGCESEEIGCDSNQWWLSTFLKNDVEHIVFTFYPWQPNFLKSTNKDWKAFANEQNQLKPQIEQLGFKYNANKGSWYLVVDGIEPAVFIDSYENDNLADALTPIVDALNKIEKAHPYFDQIVQAAIAKFGRVEVEETV